MKYFLIGIVLAAVGLVLSILIWGVDQMYMIPSYAGFFFIGVAMISSGAMVSGDRMRANYATEEKKDRRSREKFALHSALIGLPNIIITALLYF